MNNIKIVKLPSQQSLEECAELLVHAYNAEPWNDEWTGEKALEKLNCFYQSPKFHGWLAFQDSQLLGCCVGNIEPYYTGDYFYLKEMFVHPESQNQKIGSLLLTTLREELKEMGIGTIILFTSKDFFPFHFYQKHGFTEMKEMRMMHLGQEN